MIFCVGAPGCGKSTIVTKYFDGYYRIYNKTNKLVGTCKVEHCRKVLEEGKSVVIDTPNRAASNRKVYLDAAKKLNVPVRCLFFDVPKEVCMHNNLQRKANMHHKHLDSPAAESRIAEFFKNFTTPSLDEGFESIITINFVADCFHSDADREAYYTT